MEVANSHDRFQFTPEQVQVLQNQCGEPLQVPVKETNKVYLEAVSKPPHHNNEAGELNKTVK